MVDITTNNYQKAIEAFFSHYCSYALTIYFQELRSLKGVTPSADARKKLLEAGLSQDEFDEDGTIKQAFEEMATEYWVRCVPGSLVELEDEKQLRILNELFVPLSQAMGAIGATGDQQMIAQAMRAMQYIVAKQIELSGSQSAKDIGLLWEGKTDKIDEVNDRFNEIEKVLGGLTTDQNTELDVVSQTLVGQQQQISLLTQNTQMILEKLGAVNPTSTPATPEVPTPASVTA
jgi:uncharacterized coiled-coil protein SlyX